MPSIQIEISDETAQRIAELAEQCTEADQQRNGATTHGALTIETVLTMLAEDAGMMMSRPGSWEGSNMWTVFEGHGYQF
jgi:hypothetical protein